MATKVFVGNLAYSTSWQTLKDHFRTAGEVAHAVVLSSGARSKGCGLVEYATPQEAQTAIETLNDTMLDGRKIQVREDREPGKDMSGGAGAGGAARKPRVPRAERPPRNFEAEVRPASARLFVSNLSWSTAKEGLADAFGAHPGMVSADIEFTWNGRAKGSGIVEFETVDQATAAMKALDRSDIDGRTIFVQYDKFVGDKEPTPSDSTAPQDY
jgi:RNA recognition motif-containing protein